MHDNTKSSQSIILRQKTFLEQSIKGDIESLLFNHFGYEASLLFFQLFLNFFFDSLFFLCFWFDLKFLFREFGFHIILQIDLNLINQLQREQYVYKQDLIFSNKIHSQNGEKCQNKTVFTLQPIINFINSQMLEDQNYSLIVQKLLLAVPKYKIAKLEAWYVHQTVISDLKRGELQIADVQADFDSYINHTIKEKALNYYNYEKDFNIMIGFLPQSQELPSKNRSKDVKVQQMLRQKKTDQQIKRQFLKKLKVWEEQKKKLAKKRQLIQRKKHLLQNSSEEKKRKQEEQINAFVKLQKKKVIEGRLKAIEQRRAKRQQILQQSSVRRPNSLPKFIQYQNKFKREELKKSLEQKILLKNRKMSLQMNLQQIKQHQKAYINRIKQRLNMKSPDNSKSVEKMSKNNQDNFNLFKRNPDEMKKLEEKIKRIKKFENKLRLMPLKIDEEKKLQSQIANDKLKNKHKYIFLSQKALSDEQIYREFKDFDINIDQREVGNKYLDEFKQKNKLLKRKVESEKVLPVKSEYKDYLKQLKQKKKSVINPDQFDVYIRKAEKTAKRQENKQLLMQKSQLLQKKAIQKIIELKNINKYQDSIKKEEQIDDNFAKAIKAKIALAKIT